MDTGSPNLGHFYGFPRELGSEVEQPTLELVPTWDSRIVGGCLARYTTTPAPILIILERITWFELTQPSLVLSA